MLYLTGRPQEKLVDSLNRTRVKHTYVHCHALTDTAGHHCSAVALIAMVTAPLVIVNFLYIIINYKKRTNAHTM